jgi:hypothetical protein
MEIEMEKILEILKKYKVKPTSLVVDFQFTEEGEYPKNIRDLKHFAGALGLCFKEEYGQFIFYLD